MRQEDVGLFWPGVSFKFLLLVAWGFILPVRSICIQTDNPTMVPTNRTANITISDTLRANLAFLAAGENEYGPASNTLTVTTSEESRLVTQHSLTRGSCYRKRGEQRDVARGQLSYQRTIRISDDPEGILANRDRKRIRRSSRWLSKM